MTYNKTPLKLKKELTINKTTNKGKHFNSGFNSINGSPREMTLNSNFSTLEPIVYTRRKDLIRDNEDLTGITERNEWDEIWKFAKMKEQEENDIIKHKRLAQKLKFNNDLKQQIVEKKRRKSKEIEETKQRDKEMMETFLQKIKLEDNKKLMQKAKVFESKKYNDKALNQKISAKRELFEQRRSIEKSILEKAQQELEEENAKKIQKKIQLK